MCSRRVSVVMADQPAPDRRRPSAWAACGWPALGGRQTLPVAIVFAIVALLTLPCLPPGICFGDFGDLQMAGAAMGIAHPPGYAIYATLCHLATWVPGLEPVRTVSLACFGSGLVAITLCSLLQIRLGVDPWVAAAMSLLLTLYPRVRLNLTAPEVYMPTLTFLAGASYLLLRYVRTGRLRDSRLAAFLFGVAMFSRPPIGLAAPFLIVAWWIGSAQWPGSLRPRLRSLACLGLIALLPALYSVGYLLIRDRPDTPYNYVEHFNADEGKLPQPQAGLSARFQRAAWVVTGRQFTEYLGGNWTELRKKSAWLLGELAPQGTIALAVLLGVLSLGACIVLRRSPAGGIVLIGLVMQSTAFVLMYRVHGQAADLLPMLYAGAVFSGSSVSWLLERTGRFRGHAAGTLFLAASAITVVESAGAACNPPWIDASAIARNAELDALPAGSVVLAMWDESVPLRYAHSKLAGRGDITILTSPPERWAALADRYSPRTVYVSRNVAPLLPGFDLEPTGALWRLRPSTSRSDAATGR